METADLAYLAGFFDGEGSVCISKIVKAGCKNPSHVLRVYLVNTDPLVIRAIHDNFGGYFQVRKDPKRPQNRICFQVALQANDALAFLQAIQPFVRMKATQVRIAVEFQLQKKRCKGPLGVPQAELDFREAQRLELSRLNWLSHAPN